MGPGRTRGSRRHLLALSAVAVCALTLVSACIPDVVPTQFSLPGCDQVGSTCGPTGDESCCAVGEVTGGDFDRINDGSYPAHVGPFVLDRYEVTVGRFRQFVAGYPQDKPTKGAGEHPRIPNSGWDPAWDAALPKSQAALKEQIGKCNEHFVTWTDEPGAQEDLPVNCVSWYVAFAFCAWDGGRLPTESEWNYAAAGGKDQRAYPWGAALPDTVGVLHDCQIDLGTCVRRVGAGSPASDGLFGQADLAGNMAEWTLDYHQVFESPCSNCAALSDGGNGREVRGGDFAHGEDALATTSRLGLLPEDPVSTVGIRCARDP